jgi:halimadienyl-diphosphate synthase
VVPLYVRSGAFVITPILVGENRDLVQSAVQTLVSQLGPGRTQGTAYDTAWGARLAPYYPGVGFEASLEWLRRNQLEDGSWGAPLTHYHDRFVSTLAAVVALAEAGNKARDRRRIQRGENALWKLVGGLGRDDSDTVGFPVVSASLADEATALGLDVPRAPIRYAVAYRKKLDSLLNQPVRDWLSTPLTYSYEALRHAAHDGDLVLETNFSVSISLSATAAYLTQRPHMGALKYISDIAKIEGSGALPNAWPINIFEIAWSLNQLGMVGAIDPDDPPVRALLDILWSAWSPEYGVSPSSHWRVADLDDTAACYVALLWGGYPVSADVFDAFEMDDFFCTYRGETNPSVSANVRLLGALRMNEADPRNQQRIKKVLTLLQKDDANGSFWWDKWHASPYYVGHSAVSALAGLAPELAHSRFKWILRTQNEDGGWGYFGPSTAEETAYCLHALLYWDRVVERIDSSRLDAAAGYLLQHVADPSYVPLWIAKSLYTPYYPVKSAIVSALYGYMQRSDSQ